MPLSLFSSQIHSSLFADGDLTKLLADGSDVAHMIAFERALAIVQGRLEIIPAQAARKISEKLADVHIEPANLAAGTRSAGVPVPALVAELRKQLSADAGAWLHWGATSQDVIDTALVLQAKVALEILGARLEKLVDTLERQSERHADQLMAGRTRSQVSTPITLGYRIAQWAHPLIDAENALPALRSAVLRVQFGGASGINSAIAPDGTAVSAALALELGLEDSPSWHVNRTPILTLAGWLQQVTSALAKMAGDLALSGRTDIAEVSSGTGGGSSTMPQKANPVQAETIQVLNSIAISAQAGLAAAASPLEERDGTAWPLEWHFLPQMLLAAGAALVHAEELATSLQAHEANLAATLVSNPEIMAETASFVLARNGVSRAEAKDLVAAAAKDPAPFAEALARISPVSLDWQKELDPQQVVAPARDMSARIFQTRRRG
ncbi:lyase family protein [Roseibium aggregatum]|uniref:3-carboxy-cis,cis-muconate cycloisomerase n=1 Tax=Roseibium aggregatum TaxID=187304 RepID=A0A0M6Y530_9HYPH|nr:lyase family protein [Roseibium aggregatum]CTQ44121.1 3-carboxy-cis,cis-muconate cycloisomerase [Roseibium aggregatum]